MSNFLKSAPVALAALFAFSATALHAGGTCPAIGYDSDCGVLITVTDSGATVALTGQGPYDGNDDALVGVINNSSQPLSQFTLSSISDGIYGFDGDGVDAYPYNAPSNAIDTTGYGGPDTYFTNINSSLTSGTVNFVTALPPGGSTYFSLEGPPDATNVVPVVDRIAPVVTVTNTTPGPPKTIQITSSDSQPMASGLKTIVVNSCTNCTASTAPFTVGTRSPVITTTTKTDPSKSSSIKITATDKAGNITVFDPVDLQIESPGRETVHSITLGPKESIVMIANGDPGLTYVRFLINHKLTPLISLENGVGKRADISRYLSRYLPTEVRIISEGPREGSAWIVFTER